MEPNESKGQAFFNNLSDNEKKLAGLLYLAHRALLSIDWDWVTGEEPPDGKTFCAVDKALVDAALAPFKGISIETKEKK